MHKIFLWIRKLWILISVLLIVTTTIVLLLTLVILPHNSSSQPKDEMAQAETPHNNDVYEHFEMFPNLHNDSFYKFLKIKEGSPIIDDVMIGEIVNYVLQNTHIPYGEIKWNYKLKDNQHLWLTFAWNDGTKDHLKSYSFVISQKS